MAWSAPKSRAPTRPGAVMADQRQGSAAVQMMRWLGDQLMGERHELRFVPKQIADMLMAGPEHVCTVCGGPMPEPIRMGRPRVRCEMCSPPRRNVSAKCRLAE